MGGRWRVGMMSPDVVACWVRPPLSNEIPLC